MAHRTRRLRQGYELARAGQGSLGKIALVGLISDEACMKHNLGISMDLIVAEATMMGMGPYTGPHQTHDIVYDACLASTPLTVDEQGGTLAQALAALPEVTKHFDRAAIDRMPDPANYLGLTADGVPAWHALTATGPCAGSWSVDRSMKPSCVASEDSWVMTMSDSIRSSTYASKAIGSWVGGSALVGLI